MLRFIGVMLVCGVLFPAQAEDFGAIYRAHVEAFNRQDADVFFARYAPSFCFHNDAVTPLGLRDTYSKHFKDGGEPIAVQYVHTLSESKTDARIWTVFMHGKRPVTRILALNKTADGWKITAETNPTRLKCAPDLLKDLPDDLAKVIGSSVEQIQKLGQLLDKKTNVDSIDWNDIYCPKGFTVDRDEWSDHDYGEDGEIDFYCRVGDAECEDGAGNPPEGSTYMEVSFRPECDGSQDAGFTLVWKGKEAFTVSVDRAYP